MHLLGFKFSLKVIFSKTTKIFPNQPQYGSLAGLDHLYSFAITSICLYEEILGNVIFKVFLDLFMLISYAIT